jgi:hypothetical protein
MAYAGAEFTGKVIRAINGEKGIVAPTFVNLASDKTGGDALKKELGKDLEYFSAPIELGVRKHNDSYISLILIHVTRLMVSPRSMVSARLTLLRRHSSRLLFPSSLVTSRRSVAVPSIST